jgi:hypothetical protein
VVGVVAVVLAVWQFLSPPTTTKTTEERTPTTTSVPGGPGPSSGAEREPQVSKRTVESSDARPDALILAFAAIGLVLVVTAAIPGQIKLGFGGATAEVAAKTAANVDVGLAELQNQLKSLEEEMDLRLGSLERAATRAKDPPTASVVARKRTKSVPGKSPTGTAVRRKRT